MTRNNLTDRRRFVRGAGAALVAPLAVGTAAAAGRVGSEADLATRVQRLEAEAALRRLHLAYVSHVNAGEHSRAARLFAGEAPVPGARRLTLAEPDGHIELSPDGAAAHVRLHCTADVVTAIDSDCTLAQMARLQGGGTVSASEARVLQSTCVLQGGTWKFATMTLATA